jgi:hypothetical protein
MERSVIREHDVNEVTQNFAALHPRYEALPAPDGQITWAIYRPLCPAPFTKIF